MQKKRVSLLNLAVLLAMLLSLMAGPVTVTAASHNAPTGSEATASAVMGFTPGNLVVYRIGVGGATSLQASGSPVFLDEYTPAGVLVQSVPMPRTVNGNNQALYASGTAITEGLITRSVDGQYLLFTGYAKTYTNYIFLSTAEEIKRVVGRVDASGNINTSTALSDFADQHSPRSVTSPNGTDLWIGGGSGGVRYTTLGATTSTQLSTDLTDINQVNIFDGQLYASSSAAGYRLVTVGTGVQPAAGQAITNLPGVPTTTGSPYGFFFTDLSASVPGVDTLYVADEGSNDGTIFKYSLVDGAWTKNGDGVAAYRVRGLTGVVDGTTVRLYATAKAGSSTSGGGELISLVDINGYNQPFSSLAFTTLAKASAYTVMRGVVLAPVDHIPTVTGVTPADESTGVAVSADITVNFSESVLAADTAFTLKCDDENQAIDVVANGASVTLDPVANLPYDALCTVTITGSGVTDQDGTPNPLAADYSWSFTTIPDTTPKVTDTLPASNAVDVTVDSNISVTFSKAVTAPESAFTITCGGIAQGFTLTGSGSAYTLDPVGELPYGQTCTVTVIADQITERMSVNFTWSFTTIPDLVPTVSSTIPASGATQVAVDATISVTFSEAVNAPAAAFALTCGTAPQAFTLTGSEAVYTLDPDSSLPHGQSCAVTVLGAQVTDLDGTHDPMSADYTWSFTTEDADTTPLEVVGRSPLPGAQNVPLNAQVIITFSEELHPDSLNPNYFALTGPYGKVPAVLTYAPDALTVTLRPEPSLLPTTNYTVTVSGETADIAGNRLGSDDTWTFTTLVEPPMQVYFGDLHNHTGYSDGSGTPAQALAAGKEAGFDFMAISDHSYSVDDAEWASTLAAVEAATTSDFVALRGFEYTQGAEGHINVWNSEKHATRTNVTGCASCEFTPNLEAGQTVQGFYPWLIADTTKPLDEAGMVMQFNHPGWINFNDWAYHPEVSAIARLEEVGNGSGNSYVFSEDEYIRSLDYGWKLGATNNADTHSTYWGANTDNRTGVLMPELTKAALLEALRQRRTFSSEDKNFQLSMKANGAWMGSEIANTGRIQFEITGTDPDGEPITRVELITDQGKVAAYTESADPSSFDWSPSVDISEGVHYFYVKVTQADGDRIVSSPVWTMGTEDISITDIVIQPTIPTVHSPSLLTVRVTNRVDESRTVHVILKVNDQPLGSAVEVIVPANGDGYANFSWQPTETGNVTITAELETTPAGDSPDDNVASLSLTVTDEHLPLILIDAGHGNLNALGREMRPFINDLSAHQYNVLKDLDGLTASDLDPQVVRLLIITAPQYAYSADELTAIANFVKDGGSLWLCGLADYTGKTPWADTVATRENAILDEIEAVTNQTINMRMNDDEVVDGNSNNGYVFGVIWSDFPSANAAGIGVNVHSLASWSLNSIRGRTVNDPLTAATPGVQILMQGDLDDGFTEDRWKNPFHTSNIDADGAGDAYLYNKDWKSAETKPANPIPLPGAAVTQLQNGAGRIMLYGDSSDPFNTFAYTAGDGKQNELFNLQAVMWLLGSPLEKSTIAEARAQTVEDQPDNLNRLVWVEGEITAAYGEFFNVLYIRDETGGITVHAPAGDIDPSAFTRGTNVRVIGTIGSYNGDTEIEFFEAEMVQVINPGSGEPAPVQLTTRQAADEANEGSLAAVVGTVMEKLGTEAIIVDDGSGPVRAFLDGYNGSFDDIEVNTPVRVVGLVSEDGEGQRIRVRNHKMHPEYPDDVTALEMRLEIATSVTAPSSVDLESEVTYTITLRNEGSLPADLVTLSDSLPAGIRFGAFTENDRGIQENNGVLSWLGTIASGEQVRVVFTAQVNKDYSLYGKTITNTASFSSPIAGSGSASAAFTVAAAPVVTLNLSVDAGKGVAPGGVVTYTLELTNTGDTTTYNVRLTDDLPAEVAFTAFTTSSGAAHAGGQITWSGNLPAGKTVTIVFTATTGSYTGYSGRAVTNTAQFTSDNAGSGSASAGFTFLTLYVLYLPVIASAAP